MENKINNELYVSVDIEANGPIPGEYSMLSFGSAVFDSSGKIIDKFQANLDELPGAKRDEATMLWWQTVPQAWELCRKDTYKPEIAMKSYLEHLLYIKQKTSQNLVCIGYPVTYDFMFIYWYLIKFTGKSPFSFSGLDIKTLSMALMKSTYQKATKKYMPGELFNKEFKHNHTALDDAIEQGYLFCNMLKKLHQ
jgi:DNA polymerase III alpha subunit (gram-positive type)